MSILNLLAAARGRVRSSGGSPPGGHPSVLVIEDNPAACGAMGAVLGRRLGLRVTCQAQPREPARLVHREHPDVVLLDGERSTEVGAELARRLQAEPDTATTAVVALTAATWAHAEWFLAEGGEEDASASSDLAVAVATARSYIPPPRRPPRAYAAQGRMV